jgi:histone H3/H4
VQEVKSPPLIKADLLIRPASVSKLAQGTGTAVELALQHHAETCIRNVIRRASELVVHSGRQHVQLADVAQAATTICLPCSSYNAHTNTCELFGKGGPSSRQTRQKGGGVAYQGYCGAHPSQCSAVRIQSCVSSNNNSNTLVPVGQAGGGHHMSRKGDAKRQRRGGGPLPTYASFCGGNPFLTQCTAQEGVDALATTEICYGGNGRHRRHNHRSTTRQLHRSGNRRKTKKQSGHHSRGGALPTYSSFCGGNPFLTQCTAQEGVDPLATTEICYGGGRSRSSKNRHSYGGNSTKAGLEKGDHSKCEAMFQKASVKAFADKAFGVCWTQQALQYLNTVLHFHVVRIVQALRTRLQTANETRDTTIVPSPLVILRSVLCEYD